jgi:hypothetical protein
MEVKRFLIRCETAYTVAQGEWAERFLQNLANSHGVGNSPIRERIDISLSDADTFPMTVAEIVVGVAEAVDGCMGRRTSLNFIG